jgi:hypothetical protein
MSGYLGQYIVIARDEDGNIVKQCAVYARNKSAAVSIVLSGNRYASVTASIGAVRCAVAA